ncbi:hypothetical protein [Mycobacterium talmoniae]|uniref:Uncharacterized protein n=1 Tax=Mycobacterium talmoniae TaxID=1858794 RepID=A0A1S1NHC8_9MYCO|nr:MULTISPECIES: hypothetical protein [Mycobacterium]OHV03813.1 hypothetical protein BKN37_13105 [Mycobacterium talmoniae]PQM44611.1 hypothetical protein C1Y40_05229 [Mycobacterium talmoniae]TDH50783.1 hypothetical protein E2F47_17360 [Mycobacterium eburneum]
MEPGNIEERVTALESQVRRLDGRVRANEQDAAAARVLAGAADRDVTEFRDELRDFRRATVASFNAVRADITDLRADMNDLRSEMTLKFTQVDNGFVEIRGKLDAAAAGQQRIVDLIQGLR